MVLKILLMLVLRPFNISEGRQRGRHQSAVRALPMGSGVLYGSPSMRSDTPFRRSRAACPNATPFILRPFPAIVNGVFPQEIRKWCFISIICLACALLKSYKRHADAFANAVPVLFSEEILENQTNLQKNFVFPMAFLQNISIIE